MPARQALVDLVDAQRAYLQAVLDSIADGTDVPEDDLRRLARQARLAWTNAAATLERSLTEPPARRIDIEQAQGVMTGLRRLVQAVHVIRLELGSRADRRPHVALRRLVTALDQTLAAIAETLATDAPAKTDLPPLRAAYHELEAETSSESFDPLMLTELDEIVDAANTVAGLLGLTPTST